MSVTAFIVLCPGKHRTGGPEALHQLAYQIDSIDGAKCYMYYYGARVAEIINEYQAIYPVEETKTLLKNGAHVIFPEALNPNDIPLNQGGSKWVWWLSVQRFHSTDKYHDCGHLFQSEYARQKYTALGFVGFMMTDYLRDVFVENKSQRRRKPWIAFNASKSALAMQHILGAKIDTAIIPIVNLTTDQVTMTLERCAIYADFGWHPGRDRLPREAVLNGCLIVTGTDGAANNPVDIPIPDQYKIPLADLENRVTEFSALLNNYAAHYPSFDGYRQQVLQQKDTFISEVEQFVIALMGSDDHSQWTRRASINAKLDVLLLHQEQCARAWQYQGNVQAFSNIQKLMTGLKV